MREVRRSSRFPSKDEACQQDEQHAITRCKRGMLDLAPNHDRLLVQERVLRCRVLERSRRGPTLSENPAMDTPEVCVRIPT